MAFVHPLDELSMADVALVGGKAARLGELAGAGFPVPHGFCVTTRAFDLCRGSAESIGRIEIREIPGVVAEDIFEHYRRLGGGAVAVRSSATSEDTQEFSFAGQYESFLQVVGEDQVLRAIRDCWASLQSPRAVEYRQRVAPGGPEPRMAVIVQSMVPARASGVMFTANPVTSERDEIVISASPGLATVVVSGQVNPDTYRLDKATLRVREREIAEKVVMAVAGDEGIQVIPVPPGRRRAATFSRRQCSDLGRLGRRIEDHFGSPQDIEFVHDGARFCIVQSRPITGLVSWGEPKKGTALSRHSFMEFTPRPLSPLFETTYLPLIGDVLERIAGEFGLVVRNGRPSIVMINGYAFFRVDGYLSIPRLAGAPLTWARYLANLWRHRWRRTLLGPYQRTVTTWRGLDAQRSPPATLCEGVTEICRANATYWRACMQNRVSGQIEETFLRLYPLVVPEKKRVPVSVFLRGHDSEPARAEREFQILADDVGRTPELRALFVESSDDDLESQLQTTPVGREWLSRFREYIARNGYQTANLDFMEPTLGESPGPLLERIRLSLVEPGPALRFRQGRQERLAAEARLKASLGPLRRTLVSWMLALLDYGLVLREDVVFFLGLGWPVVRRFILELGARMAREGFLDAGPDVFFVTQAEINAVFGAGRTSIDAAELRRNVQVRREQWKGQLQLKPPALIPSFFRILGIRLSRYMPMHGRAAARNRICGIPVSSGHVTAPASVVGSLQEFHAMRPGSVLVAPMTSPAWTPLLAVAAGVVTDVGGLLSHASIVAREYGIPAVIGTGNATRRITDGQIVTVDGDRGWVTLLDAGS